MQKSCYFILLSSSDSMTYAAIMEYLISMLAQLMVSESEDLTEQGTFDLVASLGQNEFEARMVHALQSSAGTLQMLLVLLR